METISIAEKCMLVQVRKFGWTASIKDTGITGEVEESKGAERGTGGYYKQLFQKSQTLDALQKNRSALTKYHETVTAPWLSRGMRIMMNRRFDEYRTRINEYKTQDQELVDLLIKNWDRYVEQDKVRLGNTFNPADYPTPERVRNQFHIQVRFFSVPVAGDFRCELAAEDLKEVRDGIEQEVEEGIQFAMKDTNERIVTALTHWIDKLTDPEEGKKNRLYKSMTDGMAELALILPTLNITGDPEMDRMAKELQQKLVARYKIDDLKEDAELRAEAKDEAEKILSNMAGFAQAA